MDEACSTGVDAHTHLDFPAFDADRHEVCDRARAAGVGGWMIAGASCRDWDRVIRVSRELRAWSALGLHPWWASEIPLSEAETALQRLAQDTTADAIGETGLDALRARDDAARKRQRDLFRAHLAIARQSHRPVILHCVRAYPELLDLIDRDGLPDAGGMIHAFSGAPAHGERAVALGLHLSFGSLVTRPRATRVRETARQVPLERLLLETDSPDQPFTPKTRGEPRDLRFVASAIGQLRGLDPTRLLQQTGDTARRLFGPTPRSAS